MRSESNRLPLLLAAGFTLFVVGCSDEPEERKPATPPVTIFSLPEVGEAPFRSFPGEVTAEHNVNLSFDVGGRLVDFPVYDGKVVKPGDLIGQLDQNDFRAALDSVQASFRAARQEYDRGRGLLERRAVSQSEVDRLREAFEVVEASQRAAQKAFDDTKLFAPIKGRISRRFVRNFQNVQAREPVVLLQDISTLEVDVQVPEAHFAMLDRNVTAGELSKRIEGSVEFPAIPGERFPLTLRSFATQANPSSRTFLVSFVLRPPEDRNILPGMTCTVHLRFRKEDGSPLVQPGLFQIPVRALLTAEGKTWVWRWDAATGKVERVPVEVATLAGDSVQIRSEGLKLGDDLVSSGVRFLSAGMTVRRLEGNKP
ncbi:efflux RND transporter periplasmic adaptor subunit [Roseimicrobium sp. ORNL1]|uniref:efflux RND transporter periplasmic adaptor subunit n=1 Tax=Roseimicrobium sp. ORNL1 TaxID=2711231 RepID=UPI0013E1DA2F|nr:efflux RND transporter periplasmic adaptor subunit [Roseimicrobium sp. ORNL1]QIF02420.1 efflux RND transporter periplasmic adaptor subunit [Roseimicrobium sp. ORNL1]